MKTMHAIVHGQVQGVWFRAWTRDMARELGVKGWVRNMPSGDVETMAQADDKALEAFLERLHGGPPLARVSRIDASPLDLEEVYDTFEVRV